MWKECQMKEKSQLSINGSHLPLDQKEDRRLDGKMMWEWICRKWRLRIGRGVYWTETHGGQLLSGPKLIKSCSVYQEEEEENSLLTSGGRGIHVAAVCHMNLYEHHIPQLLFSHAKKWIKCPSRSIGNCPWTWMDDGEVLLQWLKHFPFMKHSKEDISPCNCWRTIQP